MNTTTGHPLVGPDRRCITLWGELDAAAARTPIDAPFAPSRAVNGRTEPAARTPEVYDPWAEPGVRIVRAVPGADHLAETSSQSDRQITLLRSLHMRPPLPAPTAPDLCPAGVRGGQPCMSRLVEVSGPAGGPRPPGSPTS
ncbi:hypothetical protein [Streptomyces atratus]|uniref:hypothetical protein n=1 Tax=Streptomyces atratus TaxID=1893 RepID=UPI0033D633BB